MPIEASRDGNIKTLESMQILKTFMYSSIKLMFNHFSNSKQEGCSKGATLISATFIRNNASFVMKAMVLANRNKMNLGPKGKG